MKEHDLGHVLRELLQQGTVGTQEEICEALEKKGFDVNQSKVSRWLRKIDAVKAKNEKGQVVYRLPKEPAPPTASTKLRDLVISYDFNETTIVVHTSPGSASMIARVLDYQRDSLKILGTVAGDDTIFILPRSVKQIKQILEAIKHLLTKEG